MNIIFRTKKLMSHMSISPKIGDRGFKRSVCLKSYNVQKKEIGFTSGFNAAKNTHYIKKTSNKSCSELNFVQTNPGARMSISPTSRAGGLKRSVHLKCYNVQKWKSPQLHS